MDLQRVAMENFVLLQAEWAVAMGRDLVMRIAASHVVVHRSFPAEYYYLFSSKEALDLLNRSQDASSIRQALDLHESEAVPALEGTSRAESAPDRCVVLVDGRLTGYFDASSLPFIDRTRSTRGAAPAEPPRRSLLADFPETVALDESVSLLVSLSAPPSESRGLPIVQPVGATIAIVVTACRSFMIEGKTEGSLVVTDAQEILPLQFKLRAVTLGGGEIRIYAFHEGTLCGPPLVLAPTVVEAQPTTSSSPSDRHEQPFDPVTGRQADLLLLILETQVDGRPGFTLYLDSRNPALTPSFQKFGPFALRTDPGPYFHGLYKEIDDFDLTTQSGRAGASQKLALYGDRLFAILFPPEVQNKLWSLKDQITSVLIQSEEPWIPWELCKLSGRENGRVIPGPFLCEGFALTRWIPSTSGRQLALTLRNMAVVVPTDSGLPLAADERDYLLSLASGQRKVTSIRARFQDVYLALASGQYDGWHFTGHGSSRAPDPNRSEMVLENGETFQPDYLAGEVTNLGEARPLVFLNACQIGRSGMSLTGIGGWARQFLAARAGAFIGAYWSVYDRSAAEFAEQVYSRLLGGLPMGRAIQEARLAIKAEGDPTWLAYTVFADPFATVQQA